MEFWPTMGFAWVVAGVGYLTIDFLHGQFPSANPKTLSVLIIILGVVTFIATL